MRQVASSSCLAQRFYFSIPSSFEQIKASLVHSSYLINISSKINESYLGNTELNYWRNKKITLRLGAIEKIILFQITQYFQVSLLVFKNHLNRMEYLAPNYSQCYLSFMPKVYPN